MSEQGRAAANPEIFAYLDRLSVAPGEGVGVHVGTVGGSAQPVTVELCAAGWRDVDGSVETVLTPVPGSPPVEVLSDPAPVRAGSYLVAPRYRLPVEWSPSAGLALGLVVCPLTVRAEPQSLMQLAIGEFRFALSLVDRDVVAEVTVAATTTRTGVTVRRLPGNWWAVAAAVDEAGNLVLVVRDVHRQTSAESAVPAVALPSCADQAGSVLVAAAGTTQAPAAMFTGKVESPVIAATTAGELAEHLAAGDGPAPGVLSQWDFAQDMVSARVTHLGTVAAEAVLVNAPMRAVTGSRWDATVLDWRQAPRQYAAVHFHDTDIDDAGWALATRVRVPPGTPSGFYAVRCRGTGGEDHVPLVVRRGRPRAEVMMLASTFTYLAYGNNSLFMTQHFDEGVVVGRSARDNQLARNPVFGRSVYDTHSDGSGVATSSMLRPILNMRFDHRSSIQDAPRNLGADLFVADWLGRVAPDHDYLTDHDLHFGGAVPEATRVLVTGTHPEYFSTQMLDAIERFLRRGGSLMYLGGNGFYWATTCHPDTPHRIEVRRSHGGTRSWESAPGEDHHASTGEPGGLWRHLGRSPNRLVGVGMAAQGWDERAPGYRRAPEASGPIAERILAGLRDDELVGTFGYAMGGAAGDEIDRMDERLGTPGDAVRLLTSTGHSRLYKLATEEVRLLSEPMDGETTDRVRSDLCIMPTGFGGHVFSVGSITWASSLAWNGFDNNVERVTRNALEFVLDGSHT